PPRLPPLLLGHVPRHGLGLGHVPRDDRLLPLPHAPLHPLPAGDLDLRDANAPAHRRRARLRPRARREDGEGTRLMSAPAAPKQPIYGYLAEFDDSDRLLGAARTVKEK